MNPDGVLRYYPGSPQLALQLTRPQDRLRLFELHGNEGRALEAHFRGAGRRVAVVAGDGFAGLKAVLPPPSRRALALIDPSYETRVRLPRRPGRLEDAQKRFATGTYAVWYPQLQRRESENLPGQLQRLAAGDWLHASLRVRAPSPDGFGLHGSGMFVFNPPWNLEAACATALPALVAALGRDPHATSTCSSARLEAPRNAILHRRRLPTSANCGTACAASREERDWDQFHSPKNLAMALIAEAAELVEHFQWLTEEESRALPPDPGRRSRTSSPTCSSTSSASPTGSTSTSSRRRHASSRTTRRNTRREGARQREEVQRLLRPPARPRCEVRRPGADFDLRVRARRAGPRRRMKMTVARITEISCISEKLRGRDRAGHRPRQPDVSKNLRGAWVKDQEVTIEKGKVTGYKVILKVTFVLAD